MSASLIPYAATELGVTPMDLGVAIGKHLGTAAIRKGKEWMSKERPVRGPSKRKKARKTPGIDRVGERVGSSSAKWDTLSRVYTNLDPQTLENTQLLNIVKTGGSTAYDRRLHDQLNFRGIKFCWNFRAEGALGTAKAFMNVAVISPKDLASNTPIPNLDFFRDPTGNDRAIDFGDAALLSLDYYCSAINTDKYIVHKRHKFEIGPSGSTEGRKEKFLEFYLPVNRQIRYESGTNFPEGRNMYVVWWFSTSDGGTPAASVRYSYRITRYFKETVGLG